MLNFDRSTVKHDILRIFKMIATSGFLTALECIKFVFGRGSVPDPAGGAYSSPPEPLAGLRGPTSKEKGGKGEGPARLTQIPGSAPECSATREFYNMLYPVDHYCRTRFSHSPIIHVSVENFSISTPIIFGGALAGQLGKCDIYSRVGTNCATTLSRMNFSGYVGYATCIQSKAHYCVLFNSRVRVRVRFNVCLYAHICTTFGCN